MFLGNRVPDFPKFKEGVGKDNAAKRIQTISDFFVRIKEFFEASYERGPELSEQIITLARALFIEWMEASASNKITISAKMCTQYRLEKEDSIYLSRVLPLFKNVIPAHIFRTALSEVEQGESTSKLFNYFSQF